VIEIHHFQRPHDTSYLIEKITDLGTLPASQSHSKEF
jgi:hypothetical protein